METVSYNRGSLGVEGAVEILKVAAYDLVISILSGNSFVERTSRD